MGQRDVVAETYDELLEVGDEYCRYVVARLRAEGVDVQFVRGYHNQLEFGDTTIGVEIKFDRILHKSGNLYLEIEERRTTDQPWVASGIYRQDRTRWYGIGDYNAWYVYEKAVLVAEHELRGKPMLEIERGTSRGFLIRPLAVPRVRERFWASPWGGKGLGHRHRT